MSKEPDWYVAETQLVELGGNAIESFSLKYATEQCSFFAFSVDHSFGDVVICLDTPDNGLLHAKRHESQTLKTWDTILRRDDGWENAQYYLRRDRLCSYNPHTANFKYPDFAKLQLSDWEEFFGSDQPPDRPDPFGHVIVIIHNVISKMITDHRFGKLLTSSPFHVGVEFPQSDLGLIIMRILNWPTHQGPRV